MSARKRVYAVLGPALALGLVQLEEIVAIRQLGARQRGCETAEVGQVCTPALWRGRGWLLRDGGNRGDERDRGQNEDTADVRHRSSRV